jgi:glycosidase
MDLIDVKLDIVSNGTQGLKIQVDKLVKGVQLSKPGSPWIQWSMGSIDTERLTSQLPTANASLAAILFEMMLPGTPSIFYGDEIGIEELKDPEQEVN